MFGEFHGLPVHALVLHAAVVLAPLAATLGIAFLVPKWRWLLRWPLVAVAAVATITLFVAKKSGEALRIAIVDQLNGDTGALVARHAQLGQRLLIALVILFVLAVFAALAQPRTGSRWIGHVLSVGLSAVAVGVLVLTYQTGEAGAKARWNPDGSFDYSGKVATGS